MSKRNVRRCTMFYRRRRQFSGFKNIEYEQRTACICLIVITCVLLVILSFRNYGDSNKITFPIDSQFAGIEECGHFPCMGNTICGDLLQGYIHVDPETPARKYKTWTIFRGVLINRHLESRRKNCTIRILESELPKFGNDGIKTDESLLEFRTTVCRDILGEDTCSVNDTIHKWKTLRRMLVSKGILDVHLVRGFSRPLQCATQRLVNRIVRRSSSKRNGRMTLVDLSYADKASLLFKLKFGTGTWLQDVFPSNEGWPFGLTYGTCGRIAVHAEMGTRTLRNAYNLPWKNRVDLASQLMEMAFQLTHTDDKYFFIFDKLSLNDFVVTVEGKLKIINPDDVIILDVSDIDSDTRHDKNECKNLQKDQNIVFVCGILFSREDKQSLLHDPEESEAFVSLLTALLDICVNRSSNSGIDFANDHISAAKKINNLLLSARPCSVDVPYRFPECQNIGEAGEIYNVPWQEVA